jgi:small-conductance mechanosensitive channel
MKTIRIVVAGLLFFSGFIMRAQDSTLQGTVENKGFIASMGSPVVLSGDTVLKIYTSFGAFTKEDRARAISARLNEIVRETEFYPDSLIAIAVENDYYIMYRDRTLMVIGRRDTIGSGMSMGEYSGQIAQTFKETLASKSKSFSIWATIKNIGYTLLVILVLLLIIKLLNWLFRKIFRYIELNKNRFFKSIKINNYEFLNAEREYVVAQYILKVLKIGLFVISFLIALPVIFSIFPATESITRKMIELVWGPVREILMSVVNYLPELITIIVIYIIFRYLVRFILFLSNEIEKKVLVIPGFHYEWAKPTYNIIRVLLYAFMFIVIFPYLPGSDSPVFRGVSVFLGVLLSLGSSTLISNAMAGLVITYMRPYKVGDRIKIDDVVGDVVEKTIMITRIKTIKDEDVTIPNAKILTGYTVNYTTPTERSGLIIHTTITIGYDVPWRKVHDMMIRAATQIPEVSSDPKPFMLQTSLDDFYISYQINAYIKDAQKILKIKSDLHQNIQDEFNRAGVEIMSPHYRAERDGNAVTIPVNWEEKTGGKGDL